MLHVVCSRSKVQDTTAKRFALEFYGSLDQQAHGQDYAHAFQQAVARMGSGGSAARAPQKHLAAGAVDYVCLLSEHGDKFPDTGHIRQGEEESDSRNFLPQGQHALWRVGGTARVARIESAGF